MTRRGAILLELLVALAILVLASSILLGTVGDVNASIARDRLKARAADLARTRMSEIELGITALEDLRGAPAADRAHEGSSRGAASSGPSRGEASRRAAGAASSRDPAGGDGADDSEFTIDASITRSAFQGLSVVELRVLHGGSSEPLFILRQLVSLEDARRGPEAGP